MNILKSNTWSISNTQTECNNGNKNIPQAAQKEFTKMKLENNR